MTVDIPEVGFDQGIVMNVDEVPAGASLLAPAVIGATLLTLNDSNDFSETGGQVKINGHVYTYTSKTDEPSTLTLAAGGLIEAFDLTEYAPRVDVYPEALEKRAQVLIPGNDDAVTAQVHSDTTANLPLGIRELSSAETVSLQLRGGSYVVTEIVGGNPLSDGSYIDPTTAPPPAPDGNVPPQVTGIVTVPTIGGVIVKWDRVVNVDATTYHVYGSTDPAFTQDTTRIVGTTDGQLLFARQVYNENAAQLMPPTPGGTFYYAVRAEDPDGVGPTSAVVTGTPDQVDGPDISVNSITGDHITGNSITADHFEAVIVMTTQILMGLLKLDGNTGIEVAQASNPARKTLISALGEGNQFVGQLTADNSEFTDNMTRRGLNNALNGTETATKGVTDPTLAPNITVSYVKQLYNGGGAPGSNQGFNRRGMAETSDTFNWYCTETVGTLTSGVQAWAKASDLGFTLFNLEPDWLGLGGVTRIGGTLYVLAAHNDGSTWVKNNWRVLKYRESDYLYLGSLGLDFTTGQFYPTIGTDGTNLLIAFQTAVGNLWFDEWNTGGTRLTRVSPGAVSQQHLSGIAKSSLGMSGTRFILARAGDISAYTTAAVRTSSDDFPQAEGNIRGLCVAGGKWHTFHPGRAIDYTLNSGQHDFFYTFADTDTTGGSLTAETRKSPTRTVTPTKFAQWVVNCPQASPDDGTVDGANTIRVYANLAGGSPTGCFRQATLTPDGNQVLVLDPVAYSGTTYVAASGFDSRTSTAQGRYVSQAVMTDGSPSWDLKGTGSGNVGKVAKWDATGEDLMPYGEYTTPNVYNAASTTVPTGAATRIRFMTKVEERGSMSHNNASGSGVFTIPEAGVYEIVSIVGLGSGGTGASRLLQLMTGAGAEITRSNGAPRSANGNIMELAHKQRFAAGDTFYFQVTQDNGGNLSLLASAPTSQVTVQKVRS
jgi:hypothetical protein